MRSVEEAVVDFETETAVPRAFLRLLADQSDAPDCTDPEAMFQAGRQLTEAAERLLHVLDENAANKRVPAVVREPRLAH